MAHPMQHYGKRSEATRETRLFDLSVRAMEDFLEEAFPCVCSIEYAGRSLEDPQCDYHDLQAMAADLCLTALMPIAPEVCP